MFAGVNTKHKVTSVGQATIHAVMSRVVIVPLQIDLVVQVYHLYQFKLLINSLNKMTYCSTYSEFQGFERYTANSVTPDLLVKDFDNLDISLLFAGDNAYYNILTIDSKGTFPGMGMIAALTPERKKIHHVNR